MSARKAAIRQMIQADHAASLAELRAIPEAHWATPVPSDEGVNWTAKDVLIHLALSEAGQLGALKRVLAGDLAVPVDFDLNRYNRSSVKKRADKAVPDLLGEIEAAHAQVLAQLEQTAEADLDRTGRHARGDTITLEEFFTRITTHRREHVQDLRRTLAR